MRYTRRAVRETNQFREMGKIIIGRELTTSDSRLPHLLCVIYTYGLPLARRYSLIFSNRYSKGAGIFDAETYISTQPAQAFEEARFPDSHEDEERGRSAVAPPGQGTQARLGETGFPRIVFPRKSVAGSQLPVARKNVYTLWQPIAGNWIHLGW